MIPITDPKSQFLMIKEEIFRTIRCVIEGGQYILGENVQTLEKMLATRLNVSDAIGVGNGTDALVLALEACEIGPGDEVITTPFTFFATAEAIARVGATPVFVDVDPFTYNIDPKKIEQGITDQTKAILPVHLFGLPANMEAIHEIAKAYDLRVIEDACQAFGAHYKNEPIGSLGDVSCFSFFPTKNFSTMGDGGLVATSNPKIAEKIRLLRAHGSEKKYIHKAVGYNSRLDELHAAILRVCLPYVDVWNNERRRLARHYDQAFKDLDWITLPYQSENHVYHLYTIQVPNRQLFMNTLKNNGIQTGIYYPKCLHLQEAFAYLGYKTGDLEVAESLSETLIAIPLYPRMASEDQKHVIQTIRQFEVTSS